MTSTITLISARFDENLSERSDQSVRPEYARGHVAGSEVKWAEAGFPSRGRSVRTWLTFWPDESAATRFLTQRAQHIPLLKSASALSVGVIQPFATHGDVNWLGSTPKPSDLTLTQRPKKGDPVFVITSVGLGGFGAGAMAFAKGTYAVRNALQQQDAVRFEAQILPDDPKIDGPTLSLWDTQEAIINFAYKSEPHKSAMEVMKHKDLLRGSFTRCVVKSFDGVWQGKRILI